LRTKIFFNPLYKPSISNGTSKRKNPKGLLKILLRNTERISSGSKRNNCMIRNKKIVVPKTMKKVFAFNVDIYTNKSISKIKASKYSILLIKRKII